MADPWSNDFAALGEQSRHGLRSLAATRASVPQETKMRFHKAHPALAALIALLVIGVTAPIAYAFVRHVIITVDPDAPPAKLQEDVQRQLDTAGVPATVKVTQPDEGTVQVRIMTSDNHLGSDLAVDYGSGSAVPAEQGRGLAIEVHGDFTDAQKQLVVDTLSTDPIIDGLDEDDATVRTAIVKALADAGFPNVEVTFAPERVTVAVWVAGRSAASRP